MLTGTAAVDSSIWQKLSRWSVRHGSDQTNPGQRTRYRRRDRPYDWGQRDNWGIHVGMTRAEARSPGTDYPAVVAEDLVAAPEQITDVSYEWVHTDQVTIDRYVSQEIHDLEAERLWPHAWNPDGSFRGMPASWDFPDPDAQAFDIYAGVLNEHFSPHPLEDRYVAFHTFQVVDANWKTTQEAFL